jgi:phage-related baseplate assembly protein
MMSRINSTGKMLLVDFATAPVLDYLAASFGLTRLPAVGAACTLQFAIVAGHLPVTIPLGTRIGSADGLVVFTTDDDLYIPAGTDTITISATCSTAGAAGNGYSVNTINVLQDPYAFIVSVENINMTAGGSDQETDAQLQSRIKLAPSEFSVAGSRNAYIFWAKSADPSIIDAKVMTYEDDNLIAPGEVDVYVLLTGGQLSNSAVNAEVEAVLSSDTVRPLTDNVQVKTPIQQNYSLLVAITPYTDATYTALNSAITLIASNWAQTKTVGLGLDIVASQLETLCMISGVYDATVTVTPASKSLTGRNLVLNDNEIGYLTGLTVTIGVSTNG